jgi:hypothetical protein
MCELSNFALQFFQKCAYPQKLQCKKIKNVLHSKIRTMKQNLALQTSLNFENYAQRALYKAWLLQGAIITAPRRVVTIGAFAPTIPAVAAIPGVADAIKITKNATDIELIVELPIQRNAQLVGGNSIAIGEITPSTLRSELWLDTKASEVPPSSGGIVPDVISDTLEASLYKDLIECMTIRTEVIRTIKSVPTLCYRLETTLNTIAGYNPNLPSLQLDKVII